MPRDLVYPPVIASAKMAFAAMGLRLDLQGGEHVPTVGGAVLASNHVSHVDFIFAGLGARPSRRLVRFMAKESIFTNRVAGPLMRGMHHICVDRSAGAESFAVALSMLRAGEVVGVFPEATISRSFQPKEFKTGAARLAQEAGVPLIPLGLWGTQRLMTYDERSSLKQRGVPIAIRVGPPVETGGSVDDVTLRLHDAVVAQVDAARAGYPDDGAGQWWQPADLGGTAPPRTDVSGPTTDPPPPL
jgi:1-acyl-sn-glycerol-3-phosphate acyltransferase